MGPKLTPPTAKWQPQSEPLNLRVNIDALLKHLKEVNPSYLEKFTVKEAAAPQPETSPDMPTIDADPGLETILQYLNESCSGARTQSDIEMTPVSSLKTPSSEQSAQTPAKGKEPRSQASAGPSAPREVPTYVKESHSETSPASSEVDDFVTVQTKSQKRKLKASKSHDNPPKKAGISVPPPKNKKAPASTSQGAPAEESEDSPMEEPPRVKVPPPLYIREKLCWQRILPMLDWEKITLTSARSTAIGIRVQCPTSDDHRSLTRLLRQEKVGFHTYALPEDRVLRVVIRGLPRELKIELIKEDLLSQELPVREVHRMYHPRTKKPFDLVLVILDLTSEGKRINQIKTVCRLSGLKVESPHGNGRMGQCHRCQMYGHSARNCFAHPRCVKCLGDHGTSDCTRTQPTEEPPSCVLCKSQGHPANYRGCPKAPKGQKRRVSPVEPTQKEAPPAETFVPAPAPATNAWAKPTPRANPPATKPAKESAAQPAKPVPAKASMPAPQPQGSPSEGTAADRAQQNLRYLRQVLASIDVERMDEVVKDLQTDFTDAMIKHWAYLKKFDSLGKTING